MWKIANTALSSLQTSYKKQILTECSILELVKGWAHKSSGYHLLTPTFVSLECLNTSFAALPKLGHSVIFSKQFFLVNHTKRSFKREIHSGESVKECSVQL